MSVGPLTRSLISLASHLRGIAGRAPVATLVTLAVAGAALLYALRARRPSRNTGPTIGGERSQRNSQLRSRTLSGVSRVTIGCDVLPGDLADDESFATLKITGSIFQNASTHSGSHAIHRPLDVRLTAVPYLKRLAEKCDLYIIVHIANDASEIAVKDALRNAGIYSAGMDERKTLFCETVNGRVSMVRQLEPHLHIDPNPDIVTNLQRFVKFVALIAPGVSSLPGPSGGNVLRFDSLEGLWSNNQ